ncbi:TetR/AcrR family transcriptional regulator [Rhodococcus sp. NPDC058521]|uniref:TetR/AcrR family transcriptional regulator n=1 Tax=Rhodococcus sp. NPDC058521 TaxID=3346536 RepID=UPI0036579C61
MNSPQPGRPRDDRIDHAVPAAVRALLAEVGYGRFTVDQVAARAGVGKAAIYRRFGSKAEMVFASAVHDVDTGPVTDTGRLESDLRALICQVHDIMDTPAARVALPALIEALTADDTLRERLTDTFLASELADVREICERAHARGELADHVDVELAHLLITGPLIAALFVFHLPVGEQLLDEIAHSVYLTLTPTSCERLASPETR